MSNFQTLGHFAQAIRSARFDKNSQRAIGTFASSDLASDGGYAVPVDMVAQIFLHGENSLLPYCQLIPTSSGLVEVPTDETMPWDSSGIIADWDGEGSTANQRKPELSMSEQRLKKLRVLVPASDELVADSQAFNAWLPTAMSRAVTWKINDAIINGIGGARMLGIMKSGARIEVAKDGAQGAGTIVAANISAMLARSLNPMASVWIMNPACYGPVSGLVAFDSGTCRLAGLPIVTTDACAALGSPGDIILAGMGGYRVLSKGPVFSQSAHLWFDQDLQAFRMTVRIDGQPILQGPTTPPNSGATRSHFVSLAERA